MLISICASAKTDSLSYALGYQTTVALLDRENKLIIDEVQAREYIRGLEENFPKTHIASDSTFIVNYALGAMQGIFLCNGIEHTSKEKRPPIDCIEVGLRMVADNALSIPQDTIDAKNYLKNFPDSIDPIDLPQDEKCKFFTAYGIMKGFQPGLQNYIVEMGKHGITANRQYYSQGMADALFSMVKPKTAYNMGKLICRSFYLEFMQLDMPGVIAADYIEGAKAALHLIEMKISREDIECLLLRKFPGDETIVSEDTYDVGLNVKPGEPHAVSWTFEAFAPAMENDCPEDVNAAMQSVTSYLLSQGIESFPLNKGEHLHYMKNETDYNYAIYQTAVSDPDILPIGYKFVFGKNGAGTTIFGIVKTEHTFKSNIETAILSVYNSDNNQMTEISFHFGDISNYKQKAKEWEGFTKRNIGKIVVAELNGEMVMAPLINSEITSGVCSVTGLNISRVNRLFAESVTDNIGGTETNSE